MSVAVLLEIGVDSLIRIIVWLPGLQNYLVPLKDLQVCPHRLSLSIMSLSSMVGS